MNSALHLTTVQSCGLKIGCAWQQFENLLFAFRIYCASLCVSAHVYKCVSVCVGFVRMQTRRQLYTHIHIVLTYIYTNCLTNAFALGPAYLRFVIVLAGAPPGAHHGPLAMTATAAEARKPKLRRFNSHDTSSNMFSVADFENARLARRNEIELKQRLARRQRNSANGSYGLGGGGAGGCPASNGYGGYSGFCGGLNGSGDYSTGDSKTSKCSSSSEVSILNIYY